MVTGSDLEWRKLIGFQKMCTGFDVRFVVHSSTFGIELVIQLTVFFIYLSPIFAKNWLEAVWEDSTQPLRDHTGQWKHR